MHVHRPEFMITPQWLAVVNNAVHIAEGFGSHPHICTSSTMVHRMHTRGHPRPQWLLQLRTPPGTGLLTNGWNTPKLNYTKCMPNMTVRQLTCSYHWADRIHIAVNHGQQKCRRWWTANVGQATTHGTLGYRRIGEHGVGGVVHMSTLLTTIQTTAYTNSIHDHALKQRVSLMTVVDR